MLACMRSRLGWPCLSICGDEEVLKSFNRCWTLAVAHKMLATQLSSPFPTGSSTGQILMFAKQNKSSGAASIAWTASSA